MRYKRNCHASTIILGYLGSSPQNYFWDPKMQKAVRGPYRNTNFDTILKLGLKKVQIIRNLKEGLCVDGEDHVAHLQSRLKARVAVV